MPDIITKDKLYRNYLPAIIVGIIAIIARLIYHNYEQGSPLYLFPIIDENEFIRNARLIAENNFHFPYHYWHPPLYTYFLAFLMKIGFSLKSIVICQMFLGVVGAILLYFTLEKINKKIALLTAFIWAVYPLEIFIETKFISENLYIFLTIILAFILIRYKLTFKRLLLIGLLTSLLICTKSQFLLFFILYLVILIIKKKIPRQQIIFFVIASLLLPVIITFHNIKKAEGHMIFVSSNGPVNLYIGNSKDISRTLNIRPYEWRESFFPSLYEEKGIKFNREDTDPNARYPYKVSSHLIKKTLKDNRNPIVWLKNLSQKTLIAFHSHETPRNYDLYDYKRWNKYIKYSVWNKPIYFPLVIFLYSAIIFIIIKWRSVVSENKSFIILLLIICNILPSIIFFNAFRYRLPIVPFIIFFSLLFYKSYWNDIRFQIINLGLIILLGTSVFGNMLIQQIPLSETFDYYGDGFLSSKKLKKSEYWFTKAIEEANKQLVKSSSRSGNRRGYEGQTSEKSGKSVFKSAQNSNKRYISPVAGTYDSYLNMGYVKERSGDIKGAIENYTKAIQLKPDYELAYNNRGAVRYKIKDFEGSISDYDKAIQLKNDYSAAYYGRGISKSEIGKNEEALIDINLAIKYDPGYDKAYANRGIVLAKLGRIEEAVADFTKAIDVNPNNFKAYFNRGMAKGNLRDLPAAIEDFSMAIKMSPNDGRSYFMRGISKIGLNQNDKGCQDLQKAIQFGFTPAIEEFENNCKE